MKNLLYISAFIVCAFCSCSSDIDDNSYRTLDIKLTRGEEAAVEAMNEFSFNLLKATEEYIKSEGASCHNYTFHHKVPHGV